MLKLGIIGVGNMGSGHANRIKEGACPNIVVTAVADRRASRRAWAQENVPGAQVFAEGSELIQAGVCDAVLIATPHYQHPTLAAEAFEAGLHVLCEKPAGVYTLQVRDMMAAADKHPDRVFAMMFNQRTNCVYRKMKEMIDGGEIGEIKRMNWIVTDWYRTQYYYDSGAWRATWKGEGGGVLLNQAPHNLDLWQWVCGMPISVAAYCDVARYHRIEVEDDATLITRYANGATGLFVTSTGEYPGTNRLEISGELGKLVLEEGVLKWWKLQESENDVRWHSDNSMPQIPYEYTEERFEDDGPQHRGIIQNFANAILHGEKLISPGVDGLNELTLSNAAYLSQWTGNSPVALPLDNGKFDAMLKERADNSLTHEELASIPEGEYQDRWQTRW